MHFDSKAQTWDENPGRVAMAEKNVQVLVSNLRLDSNMTLLDYGAGTGLVSIALHPHVGSVIGMEPSQGMAERFREKIAANHLKNIEVRVFDPAGPSLPGIADHSLDVIVSTMTFHHVPDIRAVLREFHRALKPGGQIGIIDLETEDGTFHDDPDAGELHHGFSREELSNAAASAGFDDVTVKPAYMHTKEKTGRSYQLLLLQARAA